LKYYRKHNVFFLFITVIVGLMTILAAYFYSKTFTGTFSISDNLEDPSIPSISISDNHTFSSLTTTLSSELTLNQHSTTFDDINLYEIMQSEGQSIDLEEEFLAYSFYVKNTGSTNTNIDYFMRLVNSTHNMDEFIRILVIEDDLSYKIYQKEDLINDESKVDDNENQSTFYFESDTIVFSGEINHFEPGEVKAFRVIIWVESNDLDIDLNLENGSIETQFVVMAVNDFQTIQLSNHSVDIWVTMRSTCIINLKVYYKF